MSNFTPQICRARPTFPPYVLNGHILTNTENFRTGWANSGVFTRLRLAALHAASAVQRLQPNEPFFGCIGGHEIPLILPKIFKKIPNKSLKKPIRSCWSDGSEFWSNSERFCVSITKMGVVLLIFSPKYHQNLTQWLIFQFMQRLFPRKTSAAAAAAAPLAAAAACLFGCLPTLHQINPLLPTHKKKRPANQSSPHRLNQLT